jgi:hypothetical protein
LATDRGFIERLCTDEGKLNFYRSIALMKDPSLGTLSTPTSDSEWDRLFTALNRIAETYDWSETTLSLHTTPALTPGGTQDTPMSRFRTISPANGPQPWLDRRVLQEMGTKEGDMLNLLSRGIVEAKARDDETKVHGQNIIAPDDDVQALNDDEMAEVIAEFKSSKRRRTDYDTSADRAWTRKNVRLRGRNPDTTRNLR